jgi:hypothetical protein
MALKMRPTGLGSGFYKDDVDYSVFCGEWCIGRIYEKRSSPEHLRWFWSLFCPSKPESLRISNQVATPGQSWKRSPDGNSQPLPTSSSSSRKPCAMPIMLSPPDISASIIA